jgi:acetylornithine deacetylase/succinyl-diaminopimelate desuccinylase-like protein
MKFSLPIGISLLAQVIEQELAIDFTLAITSDEELGGFHGARYLADEYADNGLQPDMAIIPDGGDNFVCINQSKGIAHLRIHAAGQPAHGAYPWEGKSAIHSLVTLARTLLDRYEKSNQAEGWHGTLSIGRITGGTQTNKLAKHAHMDIDLRFTAEEFTLEEAIQWVEEQAAAVDEELQLEILTTGHPTHTPEENAYLQLFHMTMEEELQRAIPLRGSHGSSDARHFGKNDIPILMLKPLTGGEHSDVEWVDVDSALAYERALRAFLERVARREFER